MKKRERDLTADRVIAFGGAGVLVVFSVLAMWWQNPGFIAITILYSIVFGCTLAILTWEDHMREQQSLICDLESENKVIQESAYEMLELALKNEARAIAAEAALMQFGEFGQLALERIQGDVICSQEGCQLCAAPATSECAESAQSDQPAHQ